MQLKQLNPVVSPLVLLKVNQWFLRYTMFLVRRCLSFRGTSLTTLWPTLPRRSPASLLPYSIQLLSHSLIMAHRNQQNTVSTRPLPTVANVHPAVARVQPLSVTPTQVISSQSSVQPSLSQVPVCSLGAAAVSSSLNHIHNHLTGELNPPSDLPSSLFTLSALPVDVHVSEKIKTKIWANEYIYFG